MLEKHSALSSIQWNRELTDFSDRYSQSPEPTSITLTLEDIPGTSIDLPIEMSEKCAIGSEKYRLINTFNKQTYNIKESIKKLNFKIHKT
jgi:hypothetical protein